MIGDQLCNRAGKQEPNGGRLCSFRPHVAQAYNSLSRPNSRVAKLIKRAENCVLQTCRDVSSQMAGRHAAVEGDVVVRKRHITQLKRVCNRRKVSEFCVFPLSRSKNSKKKVMGFSWNCGKNHALKCVRSCVVYGYFNETHVRCKCRHVSQLADFVRRGVSGTRLLSVRKGPVVRSNNEVAASRKCRKCLTARDVARSSLPKRSVAALGVP